MILGKFRKFQSLRVYVTVMINTHLVYSSCLGAFAKSASSCLTFSSNLKINKHIYIYLSIIAILSFCATLDNIITCIGFSQSLMILTIVMALRQRNADSVNLEWESKQKYKA